MNKRSLHHFYRYFDQIKPWHLALVLAGFVGLSIWALRDNSQRLAPLVEAVIAADREDSDVDSALRGLGNYVTNHMNTQLEKPIQLAYTYDRDAQDILDKAEATADGEIYRKAQAACENPSVLLSVRAFCIQDYVTRNAPPGQEPVQVKFPDEAAYTFTFVSPRWSPDLAGWLVALSVMSAILLVSWIVLGWWARRILRSHL